MHVSYIETGQRGPELKTLLILTETLDVPVQELVEGLSVPKQRRLSERGKRPSAES